jgi:hypothetical protein
MQVYIVHSYGEFMRAYSTLGKAMDSLAQVPEDERGTWSISPLEVDEEQQGGLTCMP